MVYRETYRIVRPPAMVARQLRHQYGDPQGDRVWRRRGLFYRERVTLDLAEGTVERRVTLPVAVRASMGLVFVLAFAVTVVGASPAVNLAVLWSSAGLAVAAAGHRCPGIASAPDLADCTTAVSRRLAPRVLLVVGASVLGFRGAVRPVAPRWAVALTVASLVLVGGGVALSAVRYGADGISTAVLPASGLLAPLLAVANLAVAGRAVRTLSPTVAAAVVTVTTAASLVVFHGYCHVTLAQLRRSDLRPLTGVARDTAAAVYVVASVALLLAAALAAGVVRPGPAAGPPLFPLSSVGSPLSAVAGFAVAAPLLVVGLSWVAYLVRAGATRVRLAVASTRRPPPGPLGSDVTVLRVESGTPFVRPMRVPVRGVVVSTAVESALDEEELAAVVTHERAHLTGRDLDVGLLATLVAYAPGGRNGVLAFTDVRGAELDADDRAADLVGTAPLVSALRTLERLRSRDSSDRRPDRTSVALSVAPYRLFFGRTLREAAYPTVDERVARLTDR